MVGKRVGAFTPERARAINTAVAFYERNGFRPNRGRKRGYRQPVDNSLAIEFRVDGCATLQYRIAGGEWTTIAVLRLRLSGADLQLSLDPDSVETQYCTWLTTNTECPAPP